MDFKYNISAPMPEAMELDGVRYTLNLSFDRVIGFYELFSKKKSNMTYDDKIEIAYEWLVVKPLKADLKTKEAVIYAINKKILKEPERNVKKEKKQRTAINYITDSKYIYAAFRQYYGINLFEVQGKLQWWEFSAMLDSLPEDSKLKQIMYIRTREVPAYNGHNLEEIARVREQQQYYFLEENFEELETEANDCLGRLFDVLEKNALRQEVTFGDG